MEAFVTSADLYENNESEQAGFKKKKKRRVPYTYKDFTLNAQARNTLRASTRYVIANQLANLIITENARVAASLASLA